MTDVTTDRGQDEAELSAADEQLLRELSERARTGGLKLTGEGGLLGRLTKMVIEGAQTMTAEAEVPKQPMVPRGPVAASGQDMLLTTKLHVPRPPPGFVP